MRTSIGDEYVLPTRLRETRSRSQIDRGGRRESSARDLYVPIAVVEEEK